MEAKHSFYLILNNSPFPGTCELQPYHSQEAAEKDMYKKNKILQRQHSQNTSSELELWMPLSAAEAVRNYPQAVGICNNMK